ncbi:MAG: MFS transporter [Betaproteobacteria bacterium]|nr:MFS transporter [Betaproteobacteria bacterium]
MRQDLDSKRYFRLRRTAYGLGAAAFVLAFFHRVAPGAIAADLRDAYSASATTLGFVAALYFYPYAAMQLPSGVLADSVGPRKLFTAGSIVAGAGSLLFAYAPGVAWLLAGRALVGLGVAVAFVSVLKLIASWYRDAEFATWVGVLMLIGNLGGMLGAYPLAWLAQIVSWRLVFAAAGAISLLVGLAIWLWVRDSPGEAGLPSPHGAPAARDHAGWWAGLRMVAANPRTWPACVMHFGLIGSYLTFAGLWAVPYLTDGLGLTRTSASLHVTVMIVAFAFACLVVGTASDRMRRRVPLLRALSLLYLASWLPWVMGWNLPASLSVLAFVLMGIGIAGASLAWALAKELNPPALAGTATSVVNTGGFLGTALFQPLVGWVLDLGGANALDDYRRAALLLALIAAGGVAAAFLVRETHCRNVYAELRTT